MSFYYKIVTIFSCLVFFLELNDARFRAPEWLREEKRAFLSTPPKSCPNVPKIANGYVESSTVKTFTSDTGSKVTVQRALFRCLDGQSPTGNPVSTCRVGLGEESDGKWSPLPTCQKTQNYVPSWNPNSDNFNNEQISMFENGDNKVPLEAPPSTDYQDAGDEKLSCDRLEEVNDDTGCEAYEKTVQYRYRKSTKTCEKVDLGCPGKPWDNTFPSLTKCKNACKVSNNNADSEPSTTTEAQTQGGQMTGGLRGPQCISGARPPHTSCRDDSPNLVSTERFDITEVMREQNKIRKQYEADAKSMPALKWDESLAVTAERWAAQCPSWHDSPDARKNPKWDYSGQNICWSSGNKMTWTECVTAWAEEVKDWKYGVGQTSSDAVVGHFTQLIWAKTLYVGCGRARCKGDWEYVLVCNYGPGGNVATYGGNPYDKPYERRY